MQEQNAPYTTDILVTESVTKAQRLMRSTWGKSLLALISFFESALPLPIITDPFLIAAILLHRAHALRLIVITTFSSILGGIAAFLSAKLFLEVLLESLSPAMVAQFEALRLSGESNIFLLTLIGAVTPIPYTVVAWVVAASEGALIPFLIASLIGRGGRYLVVGYSVYRFGPMAVQYARRYLSLTSVALMLLVAVYVFIKM